MSCVRLGSQPIDLMEIIILSDFEEKKKKIVSLSLHRNQNVRIYRSGESKIVFFV